MGGATGFGTAGAGMIAQPQLNAGDSTTLVAAGTQNVFPNAKNGGFAILAGAGTENVFPNAQNGGSAILAAAGSEIVLAFPGRFFAVTSLAAVTGEIAQSQVGNNTSALLAVAGGQTVTASLGRFFASATFGAVTVQIAQPQVGNNTSALLVAASGENVDTSLGRWFASVTWAPFFQLGSVVGVGNAASAALVASVSEVAQAQSNSAAGAATFAAVTTQVAHPQVGMNDSATFVAVTTQVGQPQVGAFVGATFAGISTLITQSSAGATAWSGLAIVAGVGTLSVNAQVGAGAQASFSARLGQNVDTPSAWPDSATLAVVAGLSVDTVVVSLPSITFNDLTLLENQQLEYFGQHDIYATGLTQIYLLLQQPAQVNPQVTFVRPDGSSFTDTAAVGQIRAITPKGLGLPGQYLVYNAVNSLFTYPGVWRIFAYGDIQGAYFYVRPQ